MTLASTIRDLMDATQFLRVMTDNLVIPLEFDPFRVGPDKLIERSAPKLPVSLRGAFLASDGSRSTWNFPMYHLVDRCDGAFMLGDLGEQRKLRATPE